MNDANKRLDRLVPALTPTERARLVLGAWKAGREPDPWLLHSRSERDAAEYNRLIGLLCAASSGISVFILFMEQRVEQVSLRWSWVATMHLAALHACAIAEIALEAVPGAKERAALRRALEPLMARFAVSVYGDSRWEQPEGSRGTGDELAAGLVDGVRAVWQQCWQELRAAEILVDEIAEQLDGEDPLHPDVRAVFDHCRADLIDLKLRIEPYTGELAQEEPDDALLERLREVVRNAAR